MQTRDPTDTDGPTVDREMIDSETISLFERETVRAWIESDVSINLSDAR